MTSTMAGSIFAMGNDLIPEIRRPVASIKMPPHAVKSLSISFVVMGMIKEALRNSVKSTINWGTHTVHVINPRLAAKIPAVKKSRIDLENRIV